MREQENERAIVNAIESMRERKRERHKRGERTSYKESVPNR